MLTTLLTAVPLAVTWMLVTSHVSIDGFFVGYVLGLAILLLLGSNEARINWRKLPDQLVGLVIYLLTLFRDIWNSSMDVTRRVLHPDLPMNPGILAVETGDSTESDAIAAFSAHGITITPGELVVDFAEKQTMFVHCLDVGASSQNAPVGQEIRLKRLRRVLGRD